MLSRKVLIIALIFGVVLIAAPKTFAEDVAAIEDAFKNGKMSGEIGSYFEYSDVDAPNADYGWATAYVTLKYETAEWNRLKAGARFFAHGELFSDHDDSTTDPFENDIETKVTLPELYLSYGVFDDSSVTLGRWDHGKNTHFDDNQSEGAFVTFKEIDNLEVVVGTMWRFAEIDYDDGEDFGRTNDAQDLGNEGTYGSGSSGYALFLEAKTKIADLIDVNPYVIHQDGYASVYGIDTKSEARYEDWDLTYGTKANYYYVNTETSGSDSPLNYSFFPYVKIGPVEITLGYANFDKGDSLNKPAWLRDYFTFMDQKKEYGNSGTEALSAKIKLSLGKFSAHFAVENNEYDFTTASGDRETEYELVFGYKFIKNLDLSVRLFDVQYENVDNKDYQKIESRLRFKF